MKRCKSIMVQGTASNVGKSIVTAALCRIFAQEGVRVAPFKAQNMALNSYVTKEGLEIGRAQAVQAEAAGIEPVAAMNPILLKPTTDSGSQVIFMGRPVGNFTARGYYDLKEKAVALVREAYETLAAGFDLIVIEGAGSPAEINLMDRDIVNMRTAEMADAPVLLVADIDRGGVFASLLGTLMLLPRPWRDRVSGLLINKFRGDPSLLAPGLRQIEGRAGKRVLGVLPWCADLGIEEEDSVALEGKAVAGNGPGLTIGVVRLPRISNYTDFDPLGGIDGVEVIYLEDPGVVDTCDAVILPGSKDTLGDLDFLGKSGLAASIRDFARRGGTVAGICGGFQMLGECVEDPGGVESRRVKAEGLALLPFRTVLVPEKITARVRAVMAGGTEELEGYEIHMGRSVATGRCRSLFRIIERNGRPVNDEEGWINGSGNLWGSYLHGIFENASFTRWFLSGLKKNNDVAAGGQDYGSRKEAAFDRLAGLFREHVDLEAIRNMAGLAREKRCRL
ncbi:MAG: cobyric acid synthase [Deltaproteobacteria bacterium]|nr:cobyric acid synthase [Deltaproteobacteria bacterium]